MNNDSEFNAGETQLFWIDSFFMWVLLILIQIFFFSVITIIILRITGWNFNDIFLLFGIYGSPFGVWLSVLVTEIGTLLISLGYLKYLRKKNIGIKKLTGIKEFNLRNNLLGIIYIPLIFFTGIIISNIQSFFFEIPSDTFIYGLIFKPKNIWELLIWIIMMFAVVGPIEELVFRGIIQKGFRNTFEEIEKPNWLAAIIGALLFSVFHVDLIRFLPILFMGLLLGLVYNSTDSSMVCAITHGTYNSITIILMAIL
ncbi:MAG: lysostaphin resistance A-like protein [Promethearchaeota archaeon]